MWHFQLFKVECIQGIDFAKSSINITLLSVPKKKRFKNRVSNETVKLAAFRGYRREKCHSLYFRICSKLEFCHTIVESNEATDKLMGRNVSGHLKFEFVQWPETANGTSMESCTFGRGQCYSTEDNEKNFHERRNFRKYKKRQWNKSLGEKKGHFCN